MIIISHSSEKKEEKLNKNRFKDTRQQWLVS